MKQLVVRFVREDAGQDLIEYVLLASFVAAGVIAGATFLGTNLNTWYSGVGTWASNISWLSDANPDVSASIEWDFYGGYKWTLPQDFVADFGVLYYWYPGSYPSGYSPKPNTTELYAALNWKMLQAKYSYAVSDTFGFPNSDGSYYIEGNLNWDVVEKVNQYFGKVTLIGHVGYQSYKNNGDYSYTDWKAGVSTDFLGVTIGFAVTGTDATSSLYTNRFGKDISDTQYVVWAQKTF